MMQKELLVIDIETTGFSSQKDCIVEIGGVILNTKNGEIKEAFNYLIKEEGLFDAKPTSWIFQNTDLTKQYLLEKGLPLESVKKTLQGFFDKYPTTAFNQKFDFGFLRNRGFFFPQLGKDPMYVATDILKINRNGKYKWPKCQECLDFFEIDEIEPHRAFEDAKLEAKIIWKLIQLKEW